MARVQPRLVERLPLVVTVHPKGPTCCSCCDVPVNSKRSNELLVRAITAKVDLGTPLFYDSFRTA